MFNNKFQNIFTKFGLLFGLLFITMLIGISNVFAINYTNIGDKSNVSVFLVSTDYANTPFQVPKDSSYNFGYVLAIDILVDNFNFNANTNYQLETYLYRQQLTNANAYTVSGLNGEACLVSYDSDKTHFNGEYPRWAFQCPHATTSITIHIYNSAGNYLWSGSNIFTWSYTYLKSSTDPINSTSSNDTQNIIDNQNQNTQDIINNQNQNTQQQIESQKVCTYYDKSSIILEKRNLSSNGSVVNNNNYGITDYIPLNSNSELTAFIGSGFTGHMCFYNINKVLISCLSYADITSSSTGTLLTIPANSSYFRAPINYNYNRPTFNLCRNGNQALNDSISSLDDTLNDDDTSGATSEASDFFSGFTTNTFGLTSIITAPLNLIQSLTSSSCSELHLPLPYLNNKYLDLPCMTSIYQTHFGAFFTMYQTITYGIIAYWVCVRIFNHVKDFKNPEHDEIEVVDL